MNYTIRYHKVVMKFLEKCDINIAQKFAYCIQILSQNPYTD